MPFIDDRLRAEVTARRAKEAEAHQAKERTALDDFCHRDNLRAIVLKARAKVRAIYRAEGAYPKRVWIDEQASHVVYRTNYAPACLLKALQQEESAVTSVEIHPEYDDTEYDNAAKPTCPIVITVHFSW